MSLKKEIQKLLKKHGVRPNTLKGQHFLIDSSILSAIAAYAELEPGDRVVEVGAGVGNLTEELLATDAEVVAIENDPALAALLRKEFKNTKQLSIVQKDVLAFSEESVARPYSVVGNVPYYIAGPIIQKFLESPHQPDRLVFTVQKEVAERLAAEAPKATFLSTVVGLFGKAEYKKTVRADRFWPAPRVDSAIISITPHTAKGGVPQDLIALVKAGFAQPRKTLANNLSTQTPHTKKRFFTALEELGFSKTVRAHELGTAQWRALLKKIG